MASAETAYICTTCGQQYAPADAPPDGCAICRDERQYVAPDGQRWTTLVQLRAVHRAEIREHEPGLTGIGMSPSFAIGQRALLLQTGGGNVLWDCTPLLDDDIVKSVRASGGLLAIAISHPHYYATLAEWAATFDATVYLHVADREWVTRPDRRITFWDGDELDLLGGAVRLLRLGGHFAGGTVLHWPAGCDGRGALLSGDIVQVVADHDWVSFMRSYPNLIPLPAETVTRIAAALEPYAFQRIYGAWFDRIVPGDGSAVVARSAARYVRALEL